MNLFLVITLSKIVFEVVLITNMFLFIDVFENRSEGIFSLLEDECKKRDPSSVNFAHTILSKSKPMLILPKIKSSEFIIRHCTKDVSYSTVYHLKS